MVKAITCIRRKPGMSVEAFQKYWRTTHARVASAIPRVRGYVQSHTILSGYRKSQPIYDGIAEMWFDDTRTLRELNRTPEFAATMADEANFIERASTVLILTEEHVIKDELVPVGGVKNVEFLTRRPGMAVDEFQDYWRPVHGPIAATIPQVQRYVQSHTRRAGYGAGRRPPWDGCAVTWFESTDAMRAAATTAEYVRTRADEANFVAAAPVIITREHVIIPAAS